MAANASLSVKERLALLQNNNNNNNNNNNSPVRPPSSAESKPQGFVALKPVTQNKPVTANKPTTPSKPAVSNKPTVSDKPSTSDKPGVNDKPAVSEKPTPTSKPTFGAKHFPSQTKPAADDCQTPNGDAPQFPKLRSVGNHSEKGATPIVPKKQCSPFQETGQGFLSKESKSSIQETEENDSVSIMREKTDSRNPVRSVSIQERLAALKMKAGVDESVDSKPKENIDISSSSNTSNSPAKFSTFPKGTTSTPSGILKPVNGSKVDDIGPNRVGLPIKPSDLAKSINQAANRVLRNKVEENISEEKKRASQLFQRHLDGKKFRKLDVASVISSASAPAKPSRLDNVDLTAFLKAYASAKENKLKKDLGECAAPEDDDDDVEELYVEAESTTVPVRARGRGSIKRATSARVSEIPVMTEEEEEEEAFHSNGPLAQGSGEPLAPEDTYDDCQSGIQQEPLEAEDPDEIYEPLDDEPDIEEPQRSPPPPDNKQTKDKDKEKEENMKKKEKAKEDLNKREEKERRKKEEDIKKFRRKFGLSESDEKVGDGVVKNNAGGGVFSKDLAVSKGEMISILRMEGNPAGKWLVQNEQGKMGFVNSNNIEISTPTIRNLHANLSPKNLMSAIKQENEAEDGPEEMYEALPEGEMDEIYEEL